jgi:hypothetical protein
MRSSGTRALNLASAIGFSFLIALTTACGGSKPEAKAPSTSAAEVERVGSPSPDPSPESTTTPTEPPKAAVVSAENGSDIIPPFTATKEPATTPKKAGGKGPKKGAAKPKKKQAKAT